MINWKTIPGWESIYEISSVGTVRRVLPRKGTPCKELRGSIGSGGYSYVHLRDQHRKHIVRTVHTLVALVFIGERPKGYEINHKNGNKQDNRPENLEYLTPKQHKAHNHQILGKGHGESVAKKTTKLIILFIREAGKTKETHQSIANRFGLSRQYVGDIINKRRWTYD